MHDDVEEGEGECAQHRRPKTRDHKPRDESREHPEEESVYDDGEKPKGQYIDRKREDKENWFQNHGDDTPHNREDECGEKTLDMNPRHHIGDNEEHQCGEEPASKYGHRIQILDNG